MFISFVHLVLSAKVNIYLYFFRAIYYIHIKQNCSLRALNRPVTAATTCEKAKYFKQYLDLDKTKTTFSASHGFVSNFFLRHGFKVSRKIIYYIFILNYMMILRSIWLEVSFMWKNYY